MDCPYGADYTPAIRQCGAIKPGEDSYVCTRVERHEGEHHAHWGNTCKAIWGGVKVGEGGIPMPEIPEKAGKPKEEILKGYMAMHKISGITSDALSCPFCNSIVMSIVDDEDIFERELADTINSDTLMTFQCESCGKVWQQVGIMVFSKPLTGKEMTHDAITTEELVSDSLKGEDFEEGASQRRINDKPESVWVTEGKVWENV